MSRNGISAADAARSKPGFERRDAPPRGIVYATLGLFAGIGLSMLFVAGLLHILEPARQTHQTAPQSAWLISRTPPLEVAPTADGAAVRAQAEEKLRDYAWVDRAGGIARIPIERAMELTARRGWPEDGGRTQP